MGYISKICKKAETSTNYLPDQTEKSKASEEEIIELFNLNNNQSVIKPLKAIIKINVKLL